MKHSKIVITGGPSSGKTTVINHLQEKGHTCFPEISRELIIASQKAGIAQPFLENPAQFNYDLLVARVSQYKEAARINESCFFDRGVHDVVGYMRYANQEIPAAFSKACAQTVYDKIFILPPWSNIHVQDNERYETFEQAQLIYNKLLGVYQDYGFTVLEVPTGKVAARVDYILHNI